MLPNYSQRKEKGKTTGSLYSNIIQVFHSHFEEIKSLTLREEETDTYALTCSLRVSVVDWRRGLAVVEGWVGGTAWGATTLWLWGAVGGWA